MPKPVKGPWKCRGTQDPTSLTHTLPFTKNPKRLLGVPEHTHTPHRAMTGLPGNLFTVRIPDQVWKDFIQIAKLLFNTLVSLYKLLTRHRRPRGCGPKLKWQLLAPVAQKKKNLLSPFLLCHICWVGKVFPWIRYSCSTHSVLSWLHNFFFFPCEGWWWNL